MFLTGSEDERVKQVAKCKSVGHPSLMHVEHISDSQRRCFGKIAVIVSGSVGDGGNIYRFRHLFPLATPDVFVNVIDDFGLNKALEHAVREHS